MCLSICEMPLVSLSGTYEHYYSTTRPDLHKHARFFFSPLQQAATFFLSSCHDLYLFLCKACHCSFCCPLSCLFLCPYLRLLFLLFFMPYINSFAKIFFQACILWLYAIPFCPFVLSASFRCLLSFLQSPVTAQTTRQCTLTTAKMVPSAPSTSSSPALQTSSSSSSSTSATFCPALRPVRLSCFFLSVRTCER